jgi:hypothetical protein
MESGLENTLANAIRDELRQVRERLRLNPSDNPLIWPIPDRLACSQRPLRDHPVFGGRGRPLPREAGPEVVAWVLRVCKLGICSVICLMHPKELRYYDGPDGIPAGLLGLYRSHGLEVRHVQWADPAHAATPEHRVALRNEVHQIKQRAYAAFEQLQKPVLLHCSAGIDRSAPVAAYIVLTEQQKRGA